MTNEIEKEFFDAFGIEPYDRYFKCSKQLERECKKICECCELSEEVRYYPEITDRILLELIEIIIKRDFDTLKLYKVDGSYHGQFDTNIDHYFANYQKNNLKNLILHICQHNSKIFDHQVRELFGVNMTTNRKR